MTSSTAIVVGPRLVVALLTLTAVGVGVAAVGGLGHSRQIPVAAQLMVVSLLITGIVGSLWFTTAFLC